MVAVFAEVRRVLKKTGTCWLNLGDSYAGNMSRVSSGRAGYGAEREGIFKRGGDGLKNKDLIGIPWRVAFALQADGWYLRQDIIWHKPNPMPESVTDRCTKAHEYIFLLTKSPKYYFDNEAIREPTNDLNTKPRSFRKSGGESTLRGDVANGYTPRENRNKRSVWTVNTKPFKEAHFATFPEKLIEPMILSGCPKGGICLDPFMGSGTTAVVAKRLKRQWLGIELNGEYIKIANDRINAKPNPML